MKNKVWIIPSLVVFVLLISSKDISSQELEDKLVVRTPSGKVTITSEDPLEDCARMIQGMFGEELNGLPEIDINCFRPRPDCSVCCFGDKCKTPGNGKCCNPNPCPPGPGEPAP